MRRESSCAENSMYKTLATILFSVVCTLAFAQRGIDTFKLYFDLNVSALNDNMEKKIDLLVYNDKIITGSKVMIIGYADFLGTEGHNRDLSIKRAESVKSYLVANGVSASDITLCEGKGEIDRTVKEKGGFPADRRVDIVVNNKVGRKNPDKPAGLKKDPGKKKPAITNITEISKLDEGSVFLLRDVYFPPDRHTIKPESITTLERLFAVLEANPKLKISIEGHVCCIKDAPDALDIETSEAHLSVNRAREIYNYLVNKGIDPERLTYAGFGRSHPIVPVEQSDEDREKNRRVEIRITSNK